MEDLLLPNQCCCPITITLIVGSVGYFIHKLAFSVPSIQSKPDVYKVNYRQDVVYLYQFRRTKNCPNLSPFCMKLEVLCRAYGISYEVGFGVMFGTSSNCQEFGKF